MEVNMNRFEVTSIPLSDYEELTDNVTGEKYHIMCPESDRICEKMNQLNDRADKIVESFTTEELLKLKWQKDMYEKFSKETMRVLNRHNVSSLKKLDQILFNQVKW